MYTSPNENTRGDHFQLQVQVESCHHHCTAQMLQTYRLQGKVVGKPSIVCIYSTKFDNLLPD